eukprot:NODE_2694_length_755_cov_21.709632_g1890_i0.p4 GENE.NODE_2694_length_755_cov_21.709632_g1890_i0~~NODE_2694_length_755_cov_21.709632_g1890_i0.p4  ORF type:complete len:82 (+),score=2.56 NODE_2694_length_755_cov_21.709632_g1890_i0:413-658(+)
MVALAVATVLRCVVRWWCWWCWWACALSMRARGVGVGPMGTGGAYRHHTPNRQLSVQQTRQPPHTPKVAHKATHTATQIDD